MKNMTIDARLAHCPNPELRAAVKRLFPIPTQEVMVDEAFSSLPFGILGAGGGYGGFRYSLKKAIIAKDWVNAEEYFLQLVEDGLEDDLQGEDRWEGPCPYSLVQLAEMLSEYLKEQHEYGY